MRSPSGNLRRGSSAPLKHSGGRNNTGRITADHRGGGHKRLYRLIDFKRNKKNVPAKVEAIEYDPNRSARIALLCYADGDSRYILAPDRLRVGSSVIAGDDNIDIQPGNSLPLKFIPVGTVVHNIELRIGKGGQLAPERRRRRPIDGQGRVLRFAETSLGRVTKRIGRVPGNGRADRQSGARKYFLGQGWESALARMPVGYPRHSQKSRGPSPWRRRGKIQGQSSDDALGQAYQRL